MASSPSHPAQHGPSWVDLSPNEALTSVLTCPQPAPRALPKIPGYLIERELGRGGMGVVYLAWHAALARPVAIKMLLAGAQASPENVGRFHAEIQSVAEIDAQVERGDYRGSSKRAKYEAYARGHTKVHSIPTERLDNQ